jgi:hypothetical protein
MFDWVIVSRQLHFHIYYLLVAKDTSFTCGIERKDPIEVYRDSMILNEEPYIIFWERFLI